ncbi:adenylate/guanylate cyclase domain-containing protein [bacterium CPR1]|nr:adenylate/guanylate cyclase domain-containing protein [bacterium CPR1]
MRGVFSRHTLFLLALVAGSLLLIQGPLHGPIQAAELWFYDLRVRAQPPRDPSPEIVYVAMDKASEMQLGALPWDRSVHARMIDILTRAQAKVIVIDILFQGQRSEPGDRALIESCRRSGRVVLAQEFESVRREDGRLVLEPVPLLSGLEEAARTGSVHIASLAKGYTRREPLRFLALFGDPVDYKKTLAMSVVALELFRGVEFSPESQGDTGQVLSQRAHLGSEVIPVLNIGASSRNELALNPPGKPFPEHSFARVLEGKVSPEVFAGKIVLIGARDDPNDRFATVSGGEEPGVLAVHGNALDTILSGKFIRRLRFELFGIPIHPFSLTWIGASLILLGATTLGHRFHPLWAVCFATLVTCLMLGFAWWAFMARGVWLFITPLAVSTWLPLAAILLYDSVSSRRALRRFLPSHTNLEEVIRRPEALERQQTLQATIMFVDLRDYTTLSEGRDPDQVRNLVSQFHTALGLLVQKHGGHVCDFQGDAQMVAFGLKGGEHAKAALNAAREVPARTRALNEAMGAELFRAGVGLCTGPVSVGYLQAGGKTQHTVLGDTTNTAARLQSAARDLGVITVVSGTTVESAGLADDLRELPPVSLKGKAEPHPIFELVYS